ncbi:MAG: hypothetical protein EKK40_07555 [Bradyrhizobiaceae bacterium]|nr:MAG: hypothetical protein EKK40_07555 [Bradyrhizobiaceae bacterium]
MKRFLVRCWGRLRTETVLGFLVATVFWVGVLGWQAAYAPTDAEKQKCYQAAEKEHYKAEECKTLWERTTSDPVAFFTLWLVIFTGGLTVSTVLLWLAGEKQARHARRAAAAQSRDMQASIVAARDANTLTRDIFVADQRPWLLWKIPPTVEMTKNGGHLHIKIDGSLTNIGKTPARNISYFAKFYVPGKNEPAINQGIAYFFEHMAEPTSFALATVLPSEKLAIRFGPTGPKISDLPQDIGFTLWLAFHARYEFAVGEQKIADIGTIYMVQPIGKTTIAFKAADIADSMTVALVEFPGVRRVT